jgi:hypothetical protein
MNQSATTTVYVNNEPAKRALTEIHNKLVEVKQAQKEAFAKGDFESLKGLDKEVKNLEASGEKLKKRYFDVSMVLKDLSGASLSDLRKALAVTNTEFNKMRQTDPGYKEKAEQVKKLSDAVDKASVAQRKNTEETKGFMGKLENLFGSVGAKVAVAFGAIGAAAATVGSFVSKIIEVRSEFEKYEAVLTNTRGSQEAAQEDMAMLTDVATQLPISLKEATESFIKLVNRGMNPSREEMVQLTDVAMSQGKSLDMFVEAMLDAQTGEFERLKEFGIRASANGDKVSFTFRGQTQTVEKTDEAIKNYLLGLGKLPGVAGSSAAVMGTLQGKISNLGDSLDKFWNMLGQGGIGKSIKEAVGYLGWFVENLTKTFGAKELSVFDNTNRKIAENNVAIKDSFDLAKNASLSKQAHAEAIKRINEQYGKYLPHLLTEKSSLQDIEEAEKAVTKAIMSQIIAKSFKEELVKATQKQVDAAKNVVEAEIEAANAQKKRKYATNADDAEHYGMMEKMNKLGQKVSQSTIDNAEKEKARIKNVYEEIAKQFSITWNEIEKISEATASKNPNSQLTDQQKKKLLEDSLKAETDAYMKQRATIKNDYLSGKIADVEAYNDKLEALEKLNLQKQLDLNKKYGGDVSKLEDDLAESQIKAKDKANAEKIKKQEETSKAIQSLVNDEYQYVIDIIDEADITETEKRNAQYEGKKLALLQQNAEGILSEKDLTEQLAGIEYQYNQDSLVNQLTTLQAKQLASENYGKSSIQIEKQLADTQMKLATNKANYQIKESKRSKDAETKDLQEKAQVAQNFITQMSASIEQAVANNEDVFAAAGRTFILLLLDVLKSQAELAIAGVTIQSLAQPDSIATFGASGLARAAILVGLIEAAFATVKGLVSKGMKSSGKKEGGYTSLGSDDDVTDFVHANEFVANADAVRNPTVKPILDVINLAQRSGTIKGINLPAVVAAQSVGRGFASGGYTSDPDKVITSSPQNTATNTNEQLMQVIASNAAIMQKVHDRLGEPLYIAIDRFERDMKRRDDQKNSILKT